MRLTSRGLVAVASALLTTSHRNGVMAQASTLTQLSSPHVLVFTATAGYRHDSIPTAIQTLGELGPTYNVTFTFSEDGEMFSSENLTGFDGVMMVSNSDAMDAANRISTGTILTPDQITSFQSWLQSGGVYVGVHSASACLYNSSFYGQEVGALFDYHPELQNATFVPLNTTHPAMTQIPARWTYEEEVYYMRSDPTITGAVVLMTVDESRYSNPGNGSTGDYTTGNPHPIAWYQDSGSGSLPLNDTAPRSGRSFYTSLGHLNSTWQDPIFQSHVMGGLMWALDGGSTRAYNEAGLVGGGGLNGTSTAGAGGGNNVTSTSGASTTASSSTTAAATSTSTSGTARSISRPGGVALKGLLAVAAISAGLALVA